MQGPRGTKTRFDTFKFMRLLNVFREAAALAEYDHLALELSGKKAKGLSFTEAGGLLIVQEWAMPPTCDTSGRAALLSKNLGEMVIEFLMFSGRTNLSAALKQAVLRDPFFHCYACFYSAARPLTTFARERVNRLWKNEHTDGAQLTDAGWAAFYATLIAPTAMGAWIMLTELRQLGLCPHVDKRDHLKEGTESARKFLEEAPEAAPEFRSLLKQGVDQLRKMETRDHNPVVARVQAATSA